MISVSNFTYIIECVLPEPHAGLLSGILFGTKASLTPELYDALVRTGTLHIIALSGTNITILTGFLIVLFTWLVPRKIASILTVFGIAGFVLFVGPSASLIRAAIMGTVSLIAVLLGKRAWALGGWMIAGGLMVAVKPGVITDLSFGLSMLSSLGIILFAKLPKEAFRGFRFDRTVPKRAWREIWLFILAELRMTVSAQLLTLPLMVVSFRNISLVSPLANILIGWAVPVIMGLGLAVCILGFLWLPVGQVVAWIAWLFLEYLVGVVTVVEKVPFASVAF
jgi:competence protein ComEC